MWTRRLALATALVAALGCDDDTTLGLLAGDGGVQITDAAPQDASRAGPSLYAGPLTLKGLGDGLQLIRDGRVLAQFSAEAFQLGRLDAPSEVLYLNPYEVFVDTDMGMLPPGLRWVTPLSADLDTDDAGLVLSLDYGPDGAATVRFSAEGADRISARFEVSAGNPDVVGLRLQISVDETERYYGLGEVFDQVEHRGTVRAMHFQADSELESGYNEAHVPIPLLLGTHGWGLFVASRRPGAFDVAHHTDDRVDVIFSERHALDFFLFGAAHPLDLTRHYYATTGAPGPVARWALGPWVWRDESEDQAEVVDDLETMRRLDLAATGYWIDRPYATAVNSFDFSAAMFPDPAAMIRRAHDLGYRMALWHTPYVGEHHEATAALHAEAEAEGYYPPRVGIQANNWGRLVDFTNPDAVRWWRSLLRRYTDLGIEGFKLDYAEDVVPGLRTVRNRWDFFDGSDEQTQHREYQRLYHQTYADVLPPSGGFLICRAGTWGDQTNGVIIWPGDFDANMATHGEAMVDRNGETYNAVGGLPATLIAGLSLGPSGYPLFGADTGGYLHSPPDKETFVRWFEQTALSTVMQVGTSSNDVAWAPTPENGFDAETLALYRIYARLHLRLWPYVWTLLERTAESGHPPQRPFGLQHPELNLHPSDVYFLGQDLLVAPVVVRDARTKRVPLPPGRWFDWWTGAGYEGGEEIIVDAPLGHLPLFLREGGIVPLLRPTIDTMAPVEDLDVDSYATTPGRLYARIAYGPAGAFETFDGAQISVRRRGEVLTLSGRAGDEFTHGFQLEVLGLPNTPSGPGEVADLLALQQVERGWVFVGGVLHVRFSSGEMSFNL